MLNCVIMRLYLNESELIRPNIKNAVSFHFFQGMWLWLSVSLMHRVQILHVLDYVFIDPFC